MRFFLRACLILATVTTTSVHADSSKEETIDLDHYSLSFSYNSTERTKTSLRIEEVTELVLLYDKRFGSPINCRVYKRPPKPDNKREYWYAEVFFWNEKTETGIYCEFSIEKFEVNNKNVYLEFIDDLPTPIRFRPKK
jgi:hypothetical protein